MDKISIYNTDWTITYHISNEEKFCRFIIVKDIVARKIPFSQHRQEKYTINRVMRNVPKEIEKMMHKNSFVYIRYKTFIGYVNPNSNE